MEKEANWPGPEGLIPALEKNAANASLHTRRFLDEYAQAAKKSGNRQLVPWYHGRPLK